MAGSSPAKAPMRTAEPMPPVHASTGMTTSLLLDANPFSPSITCWEANDATTPVPLDRALTDLVDLVAERNFDAYEPDEHGRLSRM